MPSTAPRSASSAVTAEQGYVSRLYERLDELRDRTAAQLAQVRRSRASGSPQNRSERDAFATLYEDRLARLRAVEERLCFGRIDLDGGEHRYVGRIGLTDDDHSPMLVDWRAPAAQPFYQATAAAPLGVVRRRHITTRVRTVTAVEDEVLTEAAGTDLTGEAALLAAVSSARTGRMGDIVATIQAEQDAVIRAQLPGVLVVQGGPGTGKTAVALHRAAYLLYSHRDRLARTGVLLVGPSPVFLRYIEQVLPALGETGVVMATPGELFPGVTPATDDSPEVAALKGDVRMAKVLERAVAARQTVVPTDEVLAVDTHRVVLRAATMAAARTRARRSRKPHNAARVVFVLEMLDALAEQLARSIGLPPDADRSGLIAELRASKDVRRVLNLAWPPLTAQGVVSTLLSDERLLASAAPHLSAGERARLLRERDAPWTAADVPLLDEAAELVGDDDSAARAQAAVRSAQRAAELEYARETLQSTGAGRGMVSAEVLAERFADDDPGGTVAERAWRDRTWAYGHVIVDEAQELSAMAWRMVVRRCPSKSMTLVGDVAQTGAHAGADSWHEVLDPVVPGRWRMAELTVNYRTPARVMAVATALLAAHGRPATAARSVREGDWEPTAHPCYADGLVATLRRVVAAELELLGEGRMAVVTPRGAEHGITSALAAVLPPGSIAEDAEGLDARVAVLPVGAVKGLEFDAVVVVEPGELVGESPRGVNDLYVALTRPTQRLRVVHARPLPAGLEGLAVVP